MKPALSIVLAAAVSAATLLAGCAKPLPVLGEVAGFELVGDDGKPFGAASLDGKIWLASFLYTSCPGPCPRLVERLKGVRREVPAGKMTLVSFSVDPAKDTPEVLTAYKVARGIGAEDGWTFVTGEPDKVIALVERGFFTAVESGDASDPEGAVSHGVRVALVDRERKIRGFYSTDTAEDLARLTRDVATLD